jgi:hypothetical protein
VNTDERTEMISILVLRTGWSETIFSKMCDKELKKIYQERVEG